MLTWTAVARFHRDPGPYVIVKIDETAWPHWLFTLRYDRSRLKLKQQFHAGYFRHCGLRDPEPFIWLPPKKRK